MRAIAQWVSEHAEELCRLLRPPGGRLPSGSTLRRALRAVDVAALEARLGAFAAGLPAPADPDAAAPWVGLAVDGKALRGANRHGARVHLVGVARHGDGVVLGQVRVADKSNEITVVPPLLAGRDLAGMVVTMDALLTQQAIAAQICWQGGHYLMVVKENQPALYAAIHTLFSEPSPAEAADYLDTATTTDKEHGRLDSRTLERSAALNAYLDWPDVGQVLRRTYRSIDLATGRVSQEVTYGVTSLRPVEVSAAHVEALWRGHWTTGARVHRVRDVTLGEDAGQQWIGNTPQALAALRNGLISLLRVLGWANIADALHLLGAVPAGR